jgi:predicted peptidase
MGQVHTPRYNTPINSNVNGFYEYLPQGYDGSNGSYPLIVFLHGKGALGTGDAATLPRVLNDGLAKLINDGKFPVSFAVNGSTHKFIVISPQFIAWQAPSDVEAVINYAVSHYRVNVNRVYITGLSMGGAVSGIMQATTAFMPTA